MYDLPGKVSNDRDQTIRRECRQILWRHDLRAAYTGNARKRTLLCEA